MGCRSASRLDRVGEGSGYDANRHTGLGVADNELVVLDGDTGDSDNGDGIRRSLGLLRVATGLSVWYVLAMAIWAR